MPDANPVVVEVTRGEAVESRHRAAVAVVDAPGAVVAAWGDVAGAIYPRSAVKPLQALALVESDAADAFGLGDAELALACASHAGTPAHVERIARWLDRLGVSPDALACGPHPPFDEAAAEALARSGRAPTRLHNNCSGKHAGFLAAARHLGAPAEGYESPDHPVQRRVRETLATMAGTDVGPVAVDGCGVPTFALPLSGLARAFARLADPSGLAPGRAAACRRLVAAMAAQPDLAGGAGRFDTEAIRAAAGALVVKGGAEGLMAAAVPGLGLGIALKVDDGAKRAAECAMATLLLRFADLDARAREAAAEWADAPVHATTGAVVGRVRPAPGWPDSARDASTRTGT